MGTVGRFLLVGLALLPTVATPGLAGAQEPPPGDRTQGARPPGATVIEVPYLPQSELLCGGAAAAMVLRYWGMVGVRADDFAHLVSEARGGMRADDLAARIRELGWEVFPFRGAYDEVRRHLRLGRPVISLIEVEGGRYHYVVLVGEAGARLVLHDPAAAPYRLVDRRTLEKAWSATGGLSLLVVPPPDRTRNVRPPAGIRTAEYAAADEMAAADTAADDPAADPSVPASPACRSRLSRAVSAATAGRSAAAAELLAEGPCADEPAFLRELAGLRLREGRAGDAIELAGRALAASPDDAHASQTLATALYVNGRPIEALEAWNRVDRPIVDLVRIAGLDRIAHLPVARQLGVAGGDTLTPRALRLAERRLEDVPAVRLSRLRYVPTGGGRVDLVASLVEDPGLPVTPVPLAGTAVRAAIHREIALSASSPFGRGETWSAAWRWWENRPAVRFGFAAPSEFGPPAVWGLTAEWARETYALPGGAPATSPGLPLAPSERTSVGLSFGQWLSPHARGTLRLGYDRREALGRHLRAGLGADVRVAADHVRLEAGADRRFSLNGSPGFTAASLRVAAVSRRRPEGLVASVRGHLQAAEAGAPGDLWPGAGVGIARPDLLRAHPLLDDGAVDGDAFDRRLAGGGVELTRWFPAGAAVRVGGAVFLDAAHRWGERPADTFVDAGLGLRLTSAAGGPVVRFDVATGLADDEWAISAGWAAEVP